MNWNYKSIEEKSNGYEDVIHELKKYNRDKYIGESEEDKKRIIEEVFKIYRDKNILPIQYYNRPGVANEIAKCINKEVSFNKSVLPWW
jgi:hypothetical protein